MSLFLCRWQKLTPNFLELISLFFINSKALLYNVVKVNDRENGERKKKREKEKEDKIKWRDEYTVKLIFEGARFHAQYPWQSASDR